MTTNPMQSYLDSHEVFLAFDNFALASAGATATTNWPQTLSEDMGVENLTSERLSSPWRSGSLTEALAESLPYVSVVFDLGQARPVGAVTLHRHNIRIPWQVLLYTADPVSSAAVADTGWLDPIVRASLEDFTWYDMPWTLGPQQRDLDRWQSLFRLDSPAFFDRTYYGVRYVELRFDTAGAGEELNDGIDYLQASLAMVVRGFRPRINMPTGWSLPVIDRSLVRRTQGAAVRGRRRPIHRGFAFTFHAIDRDEAFEQILTRWVSQSGLLGLAFAWPEPAQRRYFYDVRLFGTLTSLPRVEMDKLEWPSAQGFVFEETE